MKKIKRLPLSRETVACLDAPAGTLRDVVAGIPHTTLCTVANCPHTT
jgi:hypothetical protein